jgi:hypothetical protein
LLANKFCEGKFEKDPYTDSLPPLSVVGVSNKNCAITPPAATKHQQGREQAPIDVEKKKNNWDNKNDETRRLIIMSISPGL